MDLFQVLETIMSDISTILNELECPVCMEYMVEEIALCVEGHSICINCKNKLRTNCPICKSSLATNRNYTLEKIAASLTYQCRNEKCNEELNAKEINDHERNCDFGNYFCGLSNFIKCEWQGKFKEVKSHMQKDHEEYINKWKYAEGLQIYVCFYLEYTFVVCFNFAHEIAMYSGLYIGPKDNARSFLLSVNFEDQSGRGYKLTGATPCVPLCEVGQVFNEDKIIFSNDMMNNFIDLRKGSYASVISVTKIKI